MKEILAAAIGIWLVFVLVFASLVGADTGEAPTPAPKAGRSPVPKSAETRASIRQAELFFSTTGPGGDSRFRRRQPAALKAGATVKASVEEKGGQKVTAIQVN